MATYGENLRSSMAGRAEQQQTVSQGSSEPSAAALALSQDIAVLEKAAAVLRRRGPALAVLPFWVEAMPEQLDLFVAHLRQKP